MLRFFRQIRQRLLTDNKFSKYLLYAVGEILLVVIGILIALQVDTWNNTKQNNERIDELLRNMMLELDADIQDIKSVLNYYHKKDSVIYLILNDKLTVDDYWNNVLPAYVETHYRIATLRENSYNELKKYFENFPKNYKPIISVITQLYLKNYYMVQSSNNQMKEHSSDNFEHRATFDWFTEPYPNEKFIDYCVNSIDRKNRVKIYETYASNHIRNFLNALYNATALYKEIGRLINKPGIDESFTLDKETLSLWTGNYQPEFDEENELTVFEDDGLLYWRHTNDTILDILFHINNTKGFSPKLGFITLVTDKDSTFIKGNDYTYIKVVSTD